MGGQRTVFNAVTLTALLLLAGLWLGPLPAMSRTAFSAHMLLHLGVVALVAPLLAAGLVRAGLRLHGDMLGVLLLMAPQLIYPADLCLGAFGFAQLEDQRFGGVLMAAWGGLVYLLGGLLLGCRLLREWPAHDQH